MKEPDLMQTIDGGLQVVGKMKDSFRYERDAE
jgi:hypothetical protein